MLMSLRNDLYKLYWEERLTQEAIGKIYGKPRLWVYEHIYEGIF